MTRSGKDNRFSRSPGGVALVWISKKGVLPIIGPRTGAQRRQSRRAGEPPNNFAVSTRRARFRWAIFEYVPEASTTAKTLYPAATALMSESLQSARNLLYQRD